MRRMTLVLVGTRRRVWLLALVWCALAVLLTYKAFARVPVVSAAASVEWSLVAFWMAVPLLAIGRLFAETKDDTFAVRYTAVRFALLGYVPLWMAMSLLDRYLVGP